MSHERIRQDQAFSLPELTGRRIAAVLGLVARASPDDQPIAINLQLDNGEWHRFFLDAGLAFWERSSHLADDDPEDDEFRLVDYGATHSLAGEALRSAEARPSIPDGSAEVTICLASGRFIRLMPSEPAALDSPSRFLLGNSSSP